MLTYLLELDQAIFEAINLGCSNIFFDFLMPVLRNKLTWIPLYFFLLFMLYKKYSSKAFYLLMLVGLLITISDTVSSKIIKNSVQRPRPCHILDASNNEINVLVRCGNGYSFTSSHATNHFAIALFFGILWRRRKYLVLFFFWAFLISFAQVYVGVHYPLDIVGGGILGTMLGILFGLIGIHIIKKYICNLNQSTRRGIT